MPAKINTSETNASTNPWFSERVATIPFEDVAGFYRSVMNLGMDAVRWLVLRDRYFLLTCVMGRADAANLFCFERCREVERDPDGHLDLWSRFHYKSTIITLAGSIQEILRDPDITIGIISYNNNIAQKFVDQIRVELEKTTLHALFPAVLWANPPQLNWSKQKGLVVRRGANPKEPTVYGFGLTDGQATGMHFRLRIYDDVVVPASVTSPEQILKTTAAWEMSRALGTTDGGRTWYAGTRYHAADTYAEILRRGAATQRRRLCVDGEGNPTLMERGALETLRREMGPTTWAAQMLQDPLSAGNKTFNDDWWNVYFTVPDRRAMRVAVIIDSANSKKKSGDYTTMWVVGLAADRNYYLLDGVHDRLNLSERTDALFALVSRWRPERVFWEQVGAMSDAQHVRLEQDNRVHHFPITDLSQRVNKNDRIRWLQPTFEAARIWFPARMIRRQADGEDRDLMVELFKNEYQTHPVCSHDDMLDALANIHHPEFTRIMAFPRRGDSKDGSEGDANRGHDWNPMARYG